MDLLSPDLSLFVFFFIAFAVGFWKPERTEGKEWRLEPSHWSLTILETLWFLIPDYHRFILGSF